MSRLKLVATAAAILGGLAVTSAAQADITMLDLTGTKDLGTWDTTTGLYAPYTINTTGGHVANALIGLGQIGKNVYGLTNDELFSLTLSGTTVTESAVGGVDGGETFVSFGSTTTGLFALGFQVVGATDVYHLYSISTSGTVTQDPGTLGIGLSLLPTAKSNSIGMSTGSSTLYLDLANALGGTNVYTLNTSTGVATLVGTVTSTPSGATEFGAITTETAANGGGFFFGSNHDGHGSHTALFKVTVSGTSPHEDFSATDRVESTGNSAHASQFWGLAPGFGATVLPEPADWALMLFGVGAVGGALRYRRSKVTAKA
jgi:hypothetical protein